MVESPVPLAEHDVEAALQQVLAAEVASRDDVAAARAQAAHIAEQGRSRARAVAERARARIAWGRERLARSLATQRAEIDAQCAALGVAPDPDRTALDALDAAVERLAAELTGALSP
jgi:hypothetical protein